MRKGELVTPNYCVTVHEIKEPTFFNRCRQREWRTDQPAVIVGETERVVKGRSIPKIQILLDGELWWATGTAVSLKVMINEAR